MSRDQDSHDAILDSLKQLVNHYSETIHTVDEVPPYFDSLLGQPAPQSKMVNFFLDRLLAQPDHSVVDWIIGYQSTVQSRLRKGDRSCVPILQHFELVLSKWLDHSESKLRDSHIAPAQENDSSMKLGDIYNDISSDLSFTSNLQSSLQVSKYVRCNILVPYLLRILHHTNRAMIILNRKMQRSDASRCVISLLPFFPSRIDPTSIAPSLLLPHGNDPLQSLCFYQPNIAPELKNMFRQIMSPALVDWSDATLDGSGVFMDSESGIALRSASSVWTSLAKVMGVAGFDGDFLDSVNFNQISSEKFEPTLPASILHLLSMEAVAGTIRAQFLGSNTSACSQLSPKMEVFMGRMQKKPAKVAGKAWKVEPLRIHALMQFVGMIREKGSSGTGTENILAEVTPCIVDLLDSTTALHVSLGASAIISLLNALPAAGTVWSKMDNDLLSVLERAFLIHRDGSVIFVIGETQCQLLTAVQVDSKKCRNLCRQWLTRLHNNTQRASSNSACWEILIGGVAPLLFQLAKLPDAQGIELGRFGLATLLPLVSGDFVDPKTQIASMVALINLMGAAYPIMPRHGGKTMSRILASFSVRANDESDEIQCLRSMAHGAATICIILCKDGARDVLDGIISDQSEYQESFLENIWKVQESIFSL